MLRPLRRIGPSTLVETAFLLSSPTFSSEMVESVSSQKTPSRDRTCPRTTPILTILLLTPVSEMLAAAKDPITNKPLTISQFGNMGVRLNTNVYTENMNVAENSPTDDGVPPTN